MGSFDFTCCVSGLPIHAGDDVVWFMLTENPYDDSLVCYMHDMWFPRSLPIRGKYNDYGSIEGYDAASPSVYAAVEGLNNDMIERGWGDNKCHDVPTVRGMSFEHVLEAIWEKRLLVSRRCGEATMKKASNDSLEANDSFAVNGQPTVKRVERALIDAGFNVRSPGANFDGYLVDEVHHGWIRVRVGDGSENDGCVAVLERAMPALLNDYAAVVTVGTGRYPCEAEIQVMPKPAKREHPVFLMCDREDDPLKLDKPLVVYQAMVLSSVWDALTKLDVGSFPWYKADAPKLTLDACRNDVRHAWDEALKDDDTAHYARMDELYGSSVSPATLLVSKSVIPFTVGLAEHFKFVARRHKDREFTVEQIDAFLDDVAGFAYVHAALAPVRHWWRPSFSCGPQFGEYDAHSKMLCAFANIAADRAAEEKARMSEWNGA